MKKVYDEIEYGNVNNAVELLENIFKCAGVTGQIIPPAQFIPGVKIA